MVLRANDDVAINGERVRLNSDDPPMPLTWEEFRARQAAPPGAMLEESGGSEESKGDQSRQPR